MQAQRRTRRRLRRREGMSLIEIMVAMVIMAMVAGAVAIGAMKSWQQAQIQETRTRARTLQSAVTQYLLVHADRDCPNVDDLLGAEILDATTDHEDGWGNAYAIQCADNVTHVRSAGPDKNMGTEDDIGF
jgi:general secretion pathway protein G